MTDRRRHKNHRNVLKLYLTLNHQYLARPYCSPSPATYQRLIADSFIKGGLEFSALIRCE